jgi:hypothetical protein
MGINYFAIDDVLKEAYLRGEKRFNAYTVAYWANQPDVKAVNKYLLTKNGNVLTSRIEFLCKENNHPTASISFGERIPGHATCHVCGDEFIPSIEHSNIVYYFTSQPPIETTTDRQKKKLQLVL